jgi:hypothetical protein
MSARGAALAGVAVERKAMTEAVMAAIFARHYPDARLPPVVTWVLAADAVRGYQRRPWTNQDAGVLAAGIRRARAERKILDQAAGILEADARRFPMNAEWQRRWEEAVQMLRMPRGAADNRHDHVSRIAKQGPAQRGWAYTARQLMGWIVSTLMAAQVPVSSSDTSPFLKSLRELLEFIYPPDELPAPSTLSKVVSDYIDGRPNNGRRTSIKPRI